MTNTALIENTTANASQVTDVRLHARYNVENVTIVDDDIDWDIYWLNMRANHVYQAGEFLNQYTGLILSSIGIPCNILTFIIMKRLKPLTSTTFIMMILAVSDASNLVFTMIDTNIFYTFTDAACQTYWTIGNLLGYMSIWLVVLLTCERLFAVCFPMKANRICTVSNACKAIICLFFVDLMVCSVHTFTSELIEHGQKISCPIKPKYAEFMDTWGPTDGAFFAVIPLTLLSLCNIIIIVKLRLSRDVLSDTSGTRDEAKRQNRSITLMLLAVSLTTIACIGPNAFIGLGEKGVSWFFSISGDINDDAMKHFIFYVILFITYSNNAVNFFLYVLSGRRFRAEFVLMSSSFLDLSLKLCRR